jgi:hypothetical protein
LKHDRVAVSGTKTERIINVLIFLADDPLLLVFSNLKFVVNNNFAKPIKDSHLINEMAERYLL